MRSICIRLGDLLRYKWPRMALIIYKKAAENADSAEKIELLLDIAVIYDEIDDVEASKETYLKVISSCPCEARAYYGLGVLYEIRKTTQGQLSII